MKISVMTFPEASRNGVATSIYRRSGLRPTALRSRAYLDSSVKRKNETEVQPVV